LEEEFNLLYDSIRSISDAKNLQDKFEQEIAQLKTNIKELTQEKEHVVRKMKEILAERDKYRKNT
jgi:HKD family nuclease